MTSDPVLLEIQKLVNELEDLENFFMLAGKWTFLHRILFKVLYWACGLLEK